MKPISRMPPFVKLVSFVAAFNSLLHQQCPPAVAKWSENQLYPPRFRLQEVHRRDLCEVWHWEARVIACPCRELSERRLGAD